MAISKREAQTILNSLNAGVVPNIGLRHIAVGRTREAQAVKKDLEHIKEGGATIRFISGRYGSGKSFMLQLARMYALDGKFVVADVDLSPDRKLHGSGGQALATYRQIVRNLSTSTRPEGNALSIIIEKWLNNIETEVSLSGDLLPNSPEFNQKVQARILAIIQNMQEMVHGFDFGMVVTSYYKGHLTDNEKLKADAIKWFRGEFATKTEAKQALGVRTIIDDDTYYDYLKIIARFTHDIGYSGLLICIDEIVNLYKIPHSVSRNYNYERILSIVNDCLQGHANHIGFIFGGTPESIEDQRRGIFSYEALRSRLASSRFATEGLQDFSNPVLSLSPLTKEEIFVLLQKIRDIHQDVNSNGKSIFDDQSIKEFMKASLNRIGAAEFVSPRDTLREFISLLNFIAQYPDKPWKEILGGIPITKPEYTDHELPEQDNNPSNIYDRFANLKTN